MSEPYMMEVRKQIRRDLSHRAGFVDACASVQGTQRRRLMRMRH